MATNNPRKNIPHSTIFEYWKDKAILENGEVVGVKDALNGNSKYEMVICDWGEPCCWACDKPIIGEYEKNREGNVDLNLIWDDKVVKSKLEKCHIIPRAKGGEDVPSNLFLMCPSCHEQSPDTVNAGNFFRWVYDQRKTHTMGFLSPSVMYEKIQQMIKRRYPNANLDEIGRVVCPAGTLQNDLYEKMTEYLKSHINSHWNSYSESTLLHGFVDWLMHEYVDKVLEVSL